MLVQAALLVLKTVQAAHHLAAAQALALAAALAQLFTHLAQALRTEPLFPPVIMGVAAAAALEPLSAQTVEPGLAD